MANEVTTLIVHTLCGLYLTVVLLRLLLQLVQADYYNPITQAVVRLSQPLVKPVSRLLPTIAHFNTATLLVAVALQTLFTAILMVMHGASAPAPALSLWGLLGALSLSLDIVFVALIISVIGGWLAPMSRNPLLLLCQQLIEPCLLPWRRWLGSLGGLDFSPLVVFLIINVLQIAINRWARGLGVDAAIVIGL